MAVPHGNEDSKEAIVGFEPRTLLVKWEPPEGFDPPTCSLRNCRSAGLSYGGICAIAFVPGGPAEDPLWPAELRWRKRKEKLPRHKDSEDNLYDADNV